MEESLTTWDQAVVTATQGMSAQGRRERTRHARWFASWCAGHGVDPANPSAAEVDAYLETVMGSDQQLRNKTRCSLRAILRRIDADRAARSIGLGNQTLQLAPYRGTPLGTLIDHLVATSGERHAVWKTYMTRLLAWCSEVGLEPTAVVLSDLFQFREWLHELRAEPGEAAVVTKAFILRRRSTEGRSLLGEPEPVRKPLRLELGAPLRPRFEFGDAFDAVSFGVEGLRDRTGVL